MAILTQQKIKEVDQEAAKVLSTIYNDGNVELPVDIGAIAKNYGLEIKSIKFPTPDIVGAYDRETKTIYIAEGTPFQRLTFTIAHELGHYILHGSTKTREIYYRTNYLDLDKQNGDEETHANWFAASLLMPEELVKKEWENNKDPIKLADIFGVSKTAMMFRLQHLGFSLK